MSFHPGSGRWAVTQTRRFKAAVTVAGIANWISMYGTSEIPSYMKCFLPNPPYGRAERHVRLSPLTFAENVRTPTLILHGESDPRVPISQSYEFYQALREVGAATTLVAYPRESHAFEERAHQADLLRRVLEWYQRHLNK